MGGFSGPQDKSDTDGQPYLTIPFTSWCFHDNVGLDPMNNPGKSILGDIINGIFYEYEGVKVHVVWTGELESYMNKY